jgi:hypothetical protein
MNERTTKQSGHVGSSTGQTAAVNPGQRSLVQLLEDPGGLGHVQRRADTPGRATLAGVGEPATEDVHAAAARGAATPSAALPHLDLVQRAFGRHDVSGIRAHSGPEAQGAARDVGAAAYATGQDVVLGDRADLFTVAHEAAHVVQQRGGIQLSGGVGAAGDAHERHADEVAALVVEGKSAEAALDRYAGGAQGATSGTQAVQGAWIADLDAKKKQAGPGQLQSNDVQGNVQQHAVRFGGLVQGCGSAMDAWLYPDDDVVGSPPSVRPSWWAAMNADPGTDAAWVSRNVVQGHLLNEHLGGPGSDMRNLTPFAKSTNSQHHSYVEKAAKAIKARKNIMHYAVEVDYSSSPPAAWFGNKIAPAYLAFFPVQIKCVLQEYDGTSRQPIGNEVTTTVTNAITGQG